MNTGFQDVQNNELFIGDSVKYENRLDEWAGRNPPPENWLGWQQGVITKVSTAIGKQPTLHLLKADGFEVLTTRLYVSLRYFRLKPVERGDHE